MNSNPNDPLLTLSEAAARMGVKERRARNILARNLVRTVRTQQGLGFRLEDVDAVRRMGN